MWPVSCFDSFFIQFGEVLIVSIKYKFMCSWSKAKSLESKFHIAFWNTARPVTTLSFPCSRYIYASQRQVESIKKKIKIRRQRKHTKNEGNIWKDKSQPSWLAYSIRAGNVNREGRVLDCLRELFRRTSFINSDNRPWFTVLATHMKVGGVSVLSIYFVLWLLRPFLLLPITQIS